MHPDQAREFYLKGVKLWIQRQPFRKSNSDNFQGILSRISSDKLLEFPPKSAVLKIPNKHPYKLATIPGMKPHLITNHVAPSTTTDKGHIVRVRKYVRSTKSNMKYIIDARPEVNNMVSSLQ
jgi:hypothetical protein